MNIRLLTYLFLSLLVFACSPNDDEQPQEQPQAVTYATVAGTWQLTQYYGKALPDGAYLYLVLDRKDHVVEIYSNLNSGYATLRKGSYSIDGDDYYGYSISGSYGVVAGDWQHTYLVSLYPSGYMIWTAKDDPSYQQTFTRVDEVPQALQMEK